MDDQTRTYLLRLVALAKLALAKHATDAQTFIDTLTPYVGKTACLNDVVEACEAFDLADGIHRTAYEVTLVTCPDGAWMPVPHAQGRLEIQTHTAAKEYGKLGIKLMRYEDWICLEPDKPDDESREPDTMLEGKVVINRRFFWGLK